MPVVQSWGRHPNRDAGFVVQAWREAEIPDGGLACGDCGVKGRRIDDARQELRAPGQPSIHDLSSAALGEDDVLPRGLRRQHRAGVAMKGLEVAAHERARVAQSLERTDRAPDLGIDRCQSCAIARLGGTDEALVLALHNKASREQCKSEHRQHCRRGEERQAIEQTHGGGKPST
jgi:hypothetical protein